MLDFAGGFLVFKMNVPICGGCADGMFLLYHLNLYNNAIMLYIYIYSLSIWSLVG